MRLIGYDVQLAQLIALRAKNVMAYRTREAQHAHMAGRYDVASFEETLDDGAGCSSPAS